MDKNRVLILALVVYCISLTLPGVSFVDRTGTHSMYGIFILGLGWVAMTKWIFAWFANPLFLFTLFRSRVEKPGVVLIVSVIAFGLGLSSFTMREIPNFSGVVTPTASLAIGYYVWMVSLGLLVCYGFFRYIHQEKPPEVAVQTTRVDFSAVFRRYSVSLIGLAVMMIMLIYALVR